MKRTLFLGLAATALVLGAGVAAGYSLSNAPIEAKAADEVYYTLTPAKGSNNAYNGNCDIDIAPSADDVSETAITAITWNLTGNSQMIPWRIGGKSLSGVDRAVYSKTAMPETITKAEMTLGTVSGVTINSASFIVASDASFEHIVDTVSLGTSIAASTTTTIAPSTGTTWSSGSYYKFNFNITVSGDKNKYFEFSEAKFYSAAASDVALTNFTIDEALEVKKGLTATIGVKYDPANATDKSLTWTSSDESIATVDSNGVVTGVELGTTVIKASKTIGETKVERSCTVTVTKTLNHAGTLDDPYDIADAKILGDHPTVGNVENVYVKGLFTKFYMNNPTTSNCSIWIGDELTQVDAATGAFEFYKITGLDEDSLAALKVGATVIGKGNITKYNTIYEFGQDCTIEYNSYAEALDFGGDFINDLATICAVTKDSASGEAPAQLKTAWGTLATAYGNLAEVEQAHVISATADEAGDNLEKAVALYDYAVAKYTDLDKFITTRVSSLGNLSNNRVSNDHNNAAWIIVAVLGVSAIVAGSVVIIAKKRRAE